MNFLHGIVGFTTDVSGDNIHTARMEAGQQNNQIDLEPQLVVFWLKLVEFGSKSRQGQVKHGVSYGCVADDGDVSLENEWFMV